MSGTERHGTAEAHDYRCMLEVKNGSRKWWCTANCPAREVTRYRQPSSQEIEASAWRREHLSAFVLKMIDCDDVQTLRALAHRLGYKEGT